MIPNKFDSRIIKLTNEANFFWREINPSAHSCLCLKKLLEYYSSQGEWEDVINLSSRAVLHLNKEYDRADFYYIWINALDETFDKNALEILAKHLIKMRKSHLVFVSLALICLIKAGCFLSAKKIYDVLCRTKNIENKFTFEAKGLFLSTKKALKFKKQAIQILKKNCFDRNSSYISWRNYIRVLSDNDELEEMSIAYKEMHIRYLFATEPYLVASLIAMDEKIGSIQFVYLKVLTIHRKNTEAIFALVQCYFELEMYIDALSILVLSKDILQENEYDYYLLFTYILKRIIEIDFDPELEEITLKSFDKLIKVADNLKIDTKKMSREYEKLVEAKESRNKATKESFNEEKSSINLNSESFLDKEMNFDFRKVV